MHCDFLDKCPLCQKMTLNLQEFEQVAPVFRETLGKLRPGTRLFVVAIPPDDIPSNKELPDFFGERGAWEGNLTKIKLHKTHECGAGFTLIVKQSNDALMFCEEDKNFAGNKTAIIHELTPITDGTYSGMAMLYNVVGPNFKDRLLIIPAPAGSPHIAYVAQEGKACPKCGSWNSNECRMVSPAKNAGQYDQHCWECGAIYDEEWWPTALRPKEAWLAERWFVPVMESELTMKDLKVDDRCRDGEGNTYLVIKHHDHTTLVQRVDGGCSLWVPHSTKVARAVEPVTIAESILSMEDI